MTTPTKAENPTDPATIVKGLSEAQRAALRSLCGEFQPPPSTTTRQAVAALAMRRADLCEREFQHGCANQTYYRLTPLGLAVLALLAQRSTTNG